MTSWPYLPLMVRCYCACTQSRVASRARAVRAARLHLHVRKEAGYLRNILDYNKLSMHCTVSRGGYDGITISILCLMHGKNESGVTPVERRTSLMSDFDRSTRRVQSLASLAGLCGGGGRMICKEFKPTQICFAGT